MRSGKLTKNDKDDRTSGSRAKTVLSILPLAIVSATCDGSATSRK
jgi:hypothetical protein